MDVEKVRGIGGTSWYTELNSDRVLQLLSIFMQLALLVFPKETADSCDFEKYVFCKVLKSRSLGGKLLKSNSWHTGKEAACLLLPFLWMSYPAPQMTAVLHPATFF